MVGEKTWNKTSEKNTKIIAITTALNENKKKLAALETRVNKGGSSDNKKKDDKSKEKKPSGDKSKLRIPEWRTINKGKTCTVDGAEWVWCKEHKSEGLFNGLYMPKGHDH